MLNLPELMLTVANSALRFNSLLSQTDPSAPMDIIRTSSPRTHTFSRLQRSRQHIGSYRHDLLVALRVVDRVEREMLRAEWESWVWSESARCRQTAEVIKRGNDDETQGLRLWWEEYCGSCLDHVNELKTL
jgi:hypothetical protein